MKFETSFLLTTTAILIAIVYLHFKPKQRENSVLSIVETTEFGRIKSVAPSNGCVLVTTDKMVVQVRNYTLNTFPFESQLVYNKYSDGTGEWSTVEKK